MDKEWLELILEAKSLGLTPEEVQEWINSQKNKLEEES